MFVLGNGSNLLVADGEHDVLGRAPGGGVRATAPRATRATWSSSTRAPVWTCPIAARRLAKSGVVGFEWAVGVPGSFGGAAVMNAGGHGSDMNESLVSVTVWHDGATRTWSKELLDYGYRTSALRRDDLVTSVRLHLRAGDSEASQERIREIVRWRREHQPGGANAGSAFRNPEDDYAGRLIEEAGCKGLRIGTAVMSEKHANFIIADADGRANDVYELLTTVRELVQRDAPASNSSANTASSDSRRRESRHAHRRARRREASAARDPAARPRVESSEARAVPETRRPRRRRLRVAAHSRWSRCWCSRRSRVAGEWVLRQSYFRVQHITFVGVRHEPLALVIAASGLEAHPTMLDVNAATVKANLAQFAWIDSVRLTKHWPNTVVVTVHESTAVAVAFNAKHVLQYVSRHGRDLGRRRCTRTCRRSQYVHPRGAPWPFSRAGRSAAFVAAQLPPAFERAGLDHHRGRPRRGDAEDDDAGDLHPRTADAVAREIRGDRVGDRAQHAASGRRRRRDRAGRVGRHRTARRRRRAI